MSAGRRRWRSDATANLPYNVHGCALYDSVRTELNKIGGQGGAAPCVGVQGGYVPPLHCRASYLSTVGFGGRIHIQTRSKRCLGPVASKAFPIRLRPRCLESTRKQAGTGIGMNIYVGNLSYEVADQDLQEAFEAYGDVSSARVITDRETARSRGFGFVEMPNQAEAEAAIQGLNGKDLKGRSINVSEARPRREGRGGSGGGGRSGRSGPDRRGRGGPRY
jgi:hypothetical protein